MCTMYGLCGSCVCLVIEQINYSKICSINHNNLERKCLVDLCQIILKWYIAVLHLVIAVECLTDKQGDWWYVITVQGLFGRLSGYNWGFYRHIIITTKAAYSIIPPEWTWCWYLYHFHRVKITLFHAHIYTLCSR